MKSFISPDDTWLLWTVILSGVAISIWLERTFRWAAKVGGPVLLLGSAMLLSNLRIMPADAPRVYDFVQTDLVQLALPLLLLRADVRKLVRTTGRLFLAFHIAAIGTVLGALLASAVLGRYVPDVEQCAAIMTASYTGGGINFFAVKASYGTSENVTNPLLVADNFIMAGMFVVLMAACSSSFLKRWYPHPHSNDAVDSRALAAEHWKRKEIALLDIAAALAVAFVVVQVSRTSSEYLLKDLGWKGTAREIAANPYVQITGWSVFVATLGGRLLSKIHGAEEIGSYLLYVFLFVIGLPADLYQVFANVPMLFVFCLVIAVVNLVVTFGAGLLLRLDLEDLGLAVNATLGGPPSAAAMSIAMGWPRLVLPAILVGIWGYVIGTAVGLAVGRVVSNFP